MPFTYNPHSNQPQLHNNYEASGVATAILAIFVLLVAITVFCLHCIQFLQSKRATVDICVQMKGLEACIDVFDAALVDMKKCHGVCSQSVENESKAKIEQWRDSTRRRLQDHSKTMRARHQIRSRKHMTERLTIPGMIFQ